VFESVEIDEQKKELKMMNGFHQKILKEKGLVEKEQREWKSEVGK
jgi:hypothetical protein